MSYMPTIRGLSDAEFERLPSHLRDEAGNRIPFGDLSSFAVYAVHAPGIKLCKRFELLSPPRAGGSADRLTANAVRYERLDTIYPSRQDVVQPGFDRLGELAPWLRARLDDWDVALIRGRCATERRYGVDRKAASWNDYQQTLMIIDVDGPDVRAFGCELTAEEIINDEAAFEEVVSHYLDHCTGGICADVSYVAKPLGSMAMSGGKYELRCHIFMQLSEALYLRQQTLVLERLEVEFRRSQLVDEFGPGVAKIIDPVLAQPNRLVLTAAPRIEMGAGNFPRAPVDCPVIYIAREKPQLVVPQEWLQQEPKLKGHSRSGRSTGIAVKSGLAGDQQLIASLAEGRFKYVVETTLVYRIACRHWRDEAGAQCNLEQIGDALRAKIDEQQAVAFKPDRERLRSTAHLKQLIRKIWAKYETRPYDPDGSNNDLTKLSGRDLQALELSDDFVKHVNAAKYPHTRITEGTRSNATTLKAARAQLAKCTQNAIKAANAYNEHPPRLNDEPDGELLAAPHFHIDATVGVGKSHAMRTAIINGFDLTSTRIECHLPDHALGDEAVASFKAQLATAAAERGEDIDVDALVRHHKGRGQPGMCPNRDQGDGTFHAMAKLYEGMAQSPLPACKACPHYKDCPWIKQSRDKGPGLIFKATAAIHTTNARNVPTIGPDGRIARSPGSPDLVIFDESILNPALAETPSLRVERLKLNKDLPLIEMKQNTIVDGVLDPDKVEYVHNRDRSDALRRLRSQVVALLRSPSLQVVEGRPVAGLLTSQHIKHAKITSIEIIDGLKLEHDHQIALLRALSAVSRELAGEVAGKQQRALEGRRKAIQGAFKASLQVAEVWTLLEAHINIKGRSEVFGVRLSDNGGVRTVTTMRAKRLPEWLARTPTIFLDGTADESVARALARCAGHQQTELKFEKCEAAPVNYRMTQVVDNAYATSRLVDGRHRARDNERAAARKEAGKDKVKLTKRRKDSRINACERRIHGLAVKHAPHDVLVICSKKVREELEGKFAENVHFMHFNALRGQDKHKNVAALVVIGRDTPNQDALELYTEALFYDDPSVTEIQRHDGTWPRGPVRLQMLDGTAIEIQGELCPDLCVEAVRQQIVVAEVKQAMGRPRLVCRVETGQPCEVYYYGQLDTGIPVHRICNLPDVTPELEDIVFERGIVYQRGETLKRVYPDFIPNSRPERNAEAARCWGAHQKPEKCMLAPLYKYYNGANLHLVDEAPIKRFREGEFRVIKNDGKKARKQRVLVAIDDHPDPNAAIEADLGQDIEWLGWLDDAPREIKLKPLRPEFAGILAGYGLGANDTSES